MTLENYASKTDSASLISDATP